MYADDNQPLVAVRIKDGIFCGNVTAAYDEDFLVMNKVTHIVNCAGGETKDLFRHSGIQYLNFPWSLPQSHNNNNACTLFDAGDKNIESVVRFVDETLAQGECVLIQSLHGRSRSCAVCAAYFIIKYRWTLDHALDFIAMAHEDMDVLPQFKKQLDVFYQRHEVPPSQTGRALDIFHPDVEDAGFALDNEQWMLRNTYVNGLVSDAQEKTDLFKVATARVVLAEQNPKSVAKRRRRITFCDTKQGTSVACMWTQPVVQHRQQPPTATIKPPADLGVSIVARPGTPHNHRLDGEAHAHVHTATSITAVGDRGGGGGDRGGCGSVIKLQLRSSLQQYQQQNQSHTLSLRHDSPAIGSQGPALVAQQQQQSQQQQSQQQQQRQQQYGGRQFDENKTAEDDTSGGYNQTVQRVLPSQQQQREDEYMRQLQQTQAQKQQQQQQQQQQQPQGPVRVGGTQVTAGTLAQPPSASNIAASLGTTGQGSLITLRGGPPISVATAAGGGGGGSQSQSQSQSKAGGGGIAPRTTQQQPSYQSQSQGGFDASKMPSMVPIPDASSTVQRPTGTGAGGAPAASGSSTTPARPGPVVTGSNARTGIQPGHNRSNPFTLPASGRTVHRGSPLPMQRQPGGGAGAGPSRIGPSSSSASGGPQRTNSPIRGAAAPTSSGYGGGSPIRSAAGIGAARGNSPMSTGLRGNSPTAAGMRGGSPTSAGLRGSGPSSSYSGNVARGSSPSGMNRAPLGGSAPRGTSPVAQRQPFGASGGTAGFGAGARPPSPSRGPTAGAGASSSASGGGGGGGSMLGHGGQQSTALWSSSLLPSHSVGGSAGGVGGAPGSSSSLLRPRTGSPLVRSNSPTAFQQQQNSARGTGGIPSANTGVSALRQPAPSRPASLSGLGGVSSSTPTSHIPRTNSPMARRTNSPMRNAAAPGSSSSPGYGTSSSFLQSQAARGGSPMARGAGNSPLARGGGGASGAGGGGSLAEQFLMRSNGPTAAGRNSPMLRR